MFHIKSIDINNFGPYREHVKVDFTDKNGVTLVWGNNGKGKTSLIRAIKYVLYDDIPEDLNETSKTIFTNTNIRAREEKKYGFSVALNFSDGDDSYELERMYTLKQDNLNAIPEDNNLYEKKVFLRKNGSFQSAQATEHILSTLMPKEVSRFFVFDGELLKEYEELLIDGSAADKIKQSIENILGLPIISNSVRDINNIENIYNKKVAFEAKKDEKTKKIGNDIEEHTTNIDQQKKDLENVLSEIKELEIERSKIENKMKQNEKYKNWIEEIKNKEKNIQDYIEDINQKKAKIKEITNDIWKAMCCFKILETLNSAKEKIKELEDRKKSNTIANEIISYMEKACSQGECDICGTTNLSSSTKNILKEKIKEFQEKIKAFTPEDEKKIEYLKSTVVPKLSDKQFELKKDSLEMLESDIGDLEIKKSNLQVEIDVIKKNINNYEEELKNVNEIVEDLVENKNKIKIKEEAKKEIKEKIDCLQKEINDCNDKIRKISSNSKNFEIIQKQHDFCRNLKKLFEFGINQFREQMKKKVEKDASDIFISIASQKEYTGLVINNNYGLEIRHKEGELVPFKSAGYSHIVALSLIGALHKNAPLEGPIIMDSPFGRLSPDHKESVTEILPTLANQVILLVYENEIDIELSKNILRDKLINEFSLNQIDAFNTKIDRK